MNADCLVKKPHIDLTVSGVWGAGQRSVVGLPWLKSRCSLLGVLGENPFLCPFWFPEAACAPWLVATSIFEASISGASSHTSSL